MLISLTSTVSRTPTPAAVPARNAPLAPVVDLAAWRPRSPQPVDASALHITPELLVALAGSWVEPAP